MAIFSSIAAAFTAVGTWFAGLSVVGQFAVRIGISLVANALSRALAGEPERKVPGIVGELKQGADVPRSFILGFRGTRGSLVYHNTWGRSGDTPNAYYTRVVALSDLPVRGLVGIWIDGTPCTLNTSAPDPKGRGFPVVEYSGEDSRSFFGVLGDRIELQETGAYNVLAWVKFYDGHQTEADPFLIEDVATAERPWTAAEVGTGMAYAVVTFKFDREKFQGLPDCLFVVDGLEISDPSGGTTASFAHNPAAQAYTLLNGLTYGGAWFYGPQGRGAGRARWNDWQAQAAACNLPVPGGVDMTEAERLEAFGTTAIPAKYRAGFEVSVGETVADVLEVILSACNGRLAEVGTRYRMTVGDPSAPVMSLTDADVISTEGQEFTPFMGLAESVNGISATYPAPGEGWAVQNAPPLYVPEYEAEDGDRRLLADVALHAVPYAEQVQRLQAAALAEARRARRHSLTLPPAFVGLEPLDVVAWSSDRNGYDAKRFRVDGAVPLPSGSLQVDLTEIDPADYAWSAADQYLPVTPGSVAPQPVPPLAVTGWAVAAMNVLDAAGVPHRPGLRLSWVPGVLPGIAGIEWQIRVRSTGAMLPTGGTSDTGAGHALVSEGILRAGGYEARARYVTSGSVPVAWTAWVPATADDIGLPGSDLAADVWESVEGIAESVVAPVRDAADDLGEAVVGLGESVDDISSDLLEIGGTVDEIGEGLAETRRAAVLREPQVRSSARAVEQLAQVVASVQLQLRETARRVADAGIYVDADSGKVSLWAQDYAQEAVNSLRADLDAAQGLLSLSVTRAEMEGAISESISEALLDPSQIPLIEDLQATLTQVSADLDAVQGALALTASAVQLDGLSATVADVSSTVDALGQAITDKVSSAEFAGAQQRLTDAEQELSTYDGAAFQRTLTDVRRVRRDADTAATRTLGDLLSRWKGDQQVREQIANVEQQVFARVSDEGVATAERFDQLLATVETAQASVLTEAKARAGADAGIAETVAALSADLGDSAAEVADLAQTRVTATEAVAAVEQQISASYGSLASLAADAKAAKAVAVEAQADIVTLEGTRVTATEAVAAVEQQISASYNSLPNLAADAKAAKAAAVEAQADIVTLEGTRVTATEAVAAVEQQISAHYNSLASLAADATAAKAVAVEAQADIVTLEGTRVTATEAVAAVEQQISAHYNSLASLAADATAAKAVAVEAQADIVALEGTRVTATEAVAAVEQRISASYGSLASLAADAKAAKAVAFEAQADIVALEGTRVTATEAVAAVEQQISAYYNSLTGLAAAAEAANAATMEAQADIVTLEGTRVTATEAVAAVEQTISASYNSLPNLAADAKAAKAAAVEAQADIVTLEGTRVTATEAVAAVEQTISARYGSIEALAEAAAFAEATAEGVRTGYVFRARAGGVSGEVELVTATDPVGGTSALFKVNADRLRFVGGLTEFFSDVQITGDLVVAGTFTRDLFANGELQVALNPIDAEVITQANDGSFHFKHAGLVEIYVIGGGGGGGAAFNDSTDKAAGAGGGAGGLCRHFIAAADPALTYTASVGGGGAGGFAGGRNDQQAGADGGTASFSGHGISMAAFGGKGGASALGGSGTITAAGGFGGGSLGAHDNFAGGAGSVASTSSALGTGGGSINLGLIGAAPNAVGEIGGVPAPSGILGMRGGPVPFLGYGGSDFHGGAGSSQPIAGIGLSAVGGHPVVGCGGGGAAKRGNDSDDEAAGGAGGDGAIFVFYYGQRNFV